MKKIQIFSLMVALTFTGTLSNAAVSLSNVYDTVGLDIFYTEPGYTYREDSFTVSPLPTTTVDFSTMGDTVVDIVWAAPTGFNFEIFVPTGSGWDTITNFSLLTEFNFGTGINGTHTFPTGVSVTFDGNAAVQALSPAGATTYRASDDLVFNSTYVDLAVGTKYLLSSITLSYTVPAAYDANFVSAPIINLGGKDRAYIGMYIDTLDQIPTDTGRILNLVAVPEPSSAFLLGIGSLLFVSGRRRSERY